MTRGNRRFSGEVIRAAMRSRVSFGSSTSASRPAFSAAPVTSAKGQTGVTGSSGFSVTRIKDSRAFFSKNAAGTRLVFGTVTVLRSSIAARE